MMSSQPADPSCVTYERRALLLLARESIRGALGGPAPLRPEGAAHALQGAGCVTLHWPGGALQGCIGSLEARRPLWEDVIENAVAAARQDPRARPMRLSDAEVLRIEVSVLSPLQVVPLVRGGGE